MRSTLGQKDLAAAQILVFEQRLQRSRVVHRSNFRAQEDNEIPTPCQSDEIGRVGLTTQSTEISCYDSSIKASYNNAKQRS